MATEIYHGSDFHIFGACSKYGTSSEQPMKLCLLWDASENCRLATCCSDTVAALRHRIYASRHELVVLHEYKVSLLLSDRAIARSPVIWGDASLSATVCVQRIKRAGLLGLSY